LEFDTLKAGERVLVTARDNNPTYTTFTVVRGYDDSDARDWDTSGGQVVYCYMLFTAGYYNELRDAVNYLENKPVVLEMSNVDLEVASVLTREISVSDGLNAAAGWNVSYGANPYSVTISSTSTITQYSGPMRFYATGNIRLDSSQAINMYAKNDIAMLADDIWLNNIFQAGLDIVRTLGVVEHSASVNFLDGLQLADKEIVRPYTCYVSGDQLLGATTLVVEDIGGDGSIAPNDKLTVRGNMYFVTAFIPDLIVPLKGTAVLKTALLTDVFDRDTVACETVPPGTMKFVSSGSPGFWGYYDAAWHKLGFTAQILIGQSTLFYCYVDGDHLAGDSSIDVKDISGDGRIIPGDKLMIENDPYNVETFVQSTPNSGTVTVDVGLINNTPDMTPVLIVRTVSDAADGYTIRYNADIDQWNATNIIVIPSHDTEHTYIHSHLDVGPTLGDDPEPRNLRVSGAVTLGALRFGDPLVPGTIQYRSNQYYATVVTVFDDEERVVEIPLVPLGAYEFLSLIEIPVGSPDGLMIKYNKAGGASSKWVATDEILVNFDTNIMSFGTTSEHIQRIEFNKPVFFNSTVALSLGYSFDQRVEFKDGIRVYNDGFTPEQSGVDPDILYECNWDYNATWKLFPGDNPRGMYLWTGRRNQTPQPPSLIKRPVYEMPYWEDVPQPQSGSYKNMMPISFEGGSDSSTASAHWEFRYIDLELKQGVYRFPPRMNEPEGYQGHLHPWWDIDQDTVEFPTDFSHLDMPREADHEGETGIYQIVVGARPEPYSYNINTFRICARDIQSSGWGDAHTGDLWVSTAREVAIDEMSFMTFDQVFIGDLYIKRPTPGPDPNYLGGHLFVDSIITIGDIVAVEETESDFLVPGAIRYTTGGLDIEDNPGDFQGYCCIGVDDQDKPWYSWVSLTGGIPRPTTQHLGGILFFNGDLFEPQWEYTDMFLLRGGWFEFDKPAVFHHDLYVDGETVVDYLEAGPIKVGDADWCNDLVDHRVRGGLIKFHDETLWIFADGMWKDLLAVNTVEIDIPIIPTEDGVVLRWDNTTHVWEATGNLRIPSTNDSVNIYVDTSITGILHGFETAYFDRSLHVTDRAYFYEMIRIGTPQQHDFEGLIRYNGDFEGFIPNIGWVSFTRHFNESLVAPATDVGQMMVSMQVGDHYDWRVSPSIRCTDNVFELALNLDVYGEITTTGSIFIDENLSVKQAIAVGNRSAVGKTFRVSAMTDSSLVGVNYVVIIDPYLIPPLVGGYIWTHEQDGNDHYYTITSVVNKRIYIDSTVTGIVFGSICWYDANAVLGVGTIAADSISTTSLNTSNLNGGYAYFSGLTVGPSNSAIPGAIKFANNEFQGCYGGGIWKSFGPIDLEDIFNVTPEWWTRSYGDVLIDDGRGRFMLADQLNVGPDKLRMGQRLLSFRDIWQINTFGPMDEGLYGQDRSFNNEFVIRNLYDAKDGSHVVNQVLRLNAYRGSVLWSDLEVGGELRVMTRLFVGDTAGMYAWATEKAIYAAGGIQITGSLLCAGGGTFGNSVTVTGEITATGHLHGSGIGITGDSSIIGGHLIQYGAHFMLGTYSQAVMYYGDLGGNWIGGDTRLEGDLTIFGSLVVQEDLRVGKTLQLGPCIPWSNEAVSEKLFVIETTEEGDIYARKSIYCDNYLVLHKPALEDYYAPKGAIRYTSEGPSDRGDWEGWDGIQWRSMTHVMIIDPMTFFGTAYHGDTIGYSEFTGNWEANNRIRSIAAWPGHEVIDRVEITTPLDLAVTTPDPVAGRIRYTGLAFQGCVDGVNWISLTLQQPIIFPAVTVNGAPVSFTGISQGIITSANTSGSGSISAYTINGITGVNTGSDLYLYGLTIKDLHLTSLGSVIGIEITSLQTDVYGDLKGLNITNMIAGSSVGISVSVLRSYNSLVTGVQVQTLSSDIGNVRAFYTNNLTAAPGYTAYSFYAVQGIGHWDTDIEVLGNVYTDHIISIGTSLSLGCPLRENVITVEAANVTHNTKVTITPYAVGASSLEALNVTALTATTFVAGLTIGALTVTGAAGTAINGIVIGNISCQSTAGPTFTPTAGILIGNITNTNAGGLDTIGIRIGVITAQQYATGILISNVTGQYQACGIIIGNITSPGLLACGIKIGTVSGGTTSNQGITIGSVTGTNAWGIYSQASINLVAGMAYYVNATKVVGARGVAVATPNADVTLISTWGTDRGTVQASINTLNAAVQDLIARLSATSGHGLIAN
jgi:hypothetical protein